MHVRSNFEYSKTGYIMYYDNFFVFSVKTINLKIISIINETAMFQQSSFRDPVVLMTEFALTLMSVLDHINQHSLNNFQLRIGKLLYSSLLGII